MKLYAPKYYESFKCIADKCRHSCCIGWEIDIDKKTAKLYDTLDSGYGQNIRKSIANDGGKHFALTQEDCCPHLDKNGLCRIITELGKEYLCNICREHPRFYNRTPYGMEVGIGAACEEACRIILSSDAYAEIEQIGTVSAKSKAPSFDAIPHRKKLYSILSDEGMAYPDKLRVIASEYGVCPELKPDEEWKELLSELEYLDKRHQDDFSCYSSSTKTPKQLEIPLQRALAYFIYRHCSAARNEAELKSAIGFCLFCERLLAVMLKNQIFPVTGAIENALRVISEELEYSSENTEAIKLEFSFLM